MVFSSTVFILGFLPLSLIGYYVCPKKIKNAFLLVASLIFFSWANPSALLLLLLSISVNYTVARIIELCREKTHKRIIIAVGVAINLLLLFYYKYFIFMLVNINSIFSLEINIPEIILPIGISFFTFQGMSYIISVYRGQVAANKNYLDIALYISLFPQLIAGPIVNYKDIAEQLRSRVCSTDLFISGTNRFIIGLSKKILIADVLGNAAADIFSMSVRGIDTPSAWLAVICYTFQIYFDFSGYSDMAIGLGRMFGFKLRENFNYPYISKSVTEFWRRWHISLSSWFRDYLYIPLGGNRKGNVYVNLFIVFCATGLWHGADWLFLVWGLWHGGFLIIEKIMMKRFPNIKVPDMFSWAITMFIVVMGWVVFNARDMGDAINIYSLMYGISSAEFVEFSFIYYLNRQVFITLCIAVIGSTPIALHCYEYIMSLANGRGAYVLRALKYVFLITLLLLCVINAVGGTYSPFIYFRF